MSRLKPSPTRFCERFLHHDHCRRIISRLDAVMRCVIPLLVVLVMRVPLSSQETWSERIVDQDINFPIPVDSCQVPGRVMQVARSINQPAGAEFLPAHCEPSKKFIDQISLRGLTAREALDRLIALDPRYRWFESEGVILVRPLVAWTDPDHFLHRTV